MFRAAMLALWLCACGARSDMSTSGESSAEDSGAGGGDGGGGAAGGPSVTAGCTDEPSVYFASPQLGRAIVADDRALFVALRQPGIDEPVLRLPFDGGEVQRTSAPDGLEQAHGSMVELAVDSRGRLFGRTFDRVVRLHLEPTPVELLADLTEQTDPPPGEASDTFGAIAVSGDTLFLGSRRALWRLPISGGLLEPVAVDVSQVRALALDATHLAFADEWGLFRVALHSAGAVERIKEASANVTAAPGGGWIATEGLRRIVRLGASGETIEVLYDASEQSIVGPLLVGGSEVYFIEERGGVGDDGILRAVPLEGGEPRDVDEIVGHSNEHPALGGGCVFYRTDMEVRMVRVRD